MYFSTLEGFPSGSDGKESACNAEAQVQSQGWEDPLEKEMDTLQYSWLENPIAGGAWRATVHRVAKSWTRLSDFTFTFKFHFHFYFHFSLSHLSWKNMKMKLKKTIPFVIRSATIKIGNNILGNKSIEKM